MVTLKSRIPLFFSALAAVSVLVLHLGDEFLLVSHIQPGLRCQEEGKCLIYKATLFVQKILSPAPILIFKSYFYVCLVPDHSFFAFCNT